MHVHVVGAGIIGCSAAAFLAEAGARVTVHDREGVGAGASGRNSGVIQHPYDPALVPLYEDSIVLHREVLDLPDEPAGILLLDPPPDLHPLPAELHPEHLDDAHAVEPLVRPGIPAVRIRTGWPVGPRAATEAWAARARDAGATFEGHADETGDVTLLATGAWTTQVPVKPMWGVTAEVDLRSEHVLEEAGVEDISAGGALRLFSLVGNVLGSTVSAEEPDVDATVPLLQERARRFIGDTRVLAARKCPRPQSLDGRPIVGRLDHRTFVCSGHGPWGISTGPATARHVARQILDGTPPPPELNPTRLAP